MHLEILPTRWAHFSLSRPVFVYKLQLNTTCPHHNMTLHDLTTHDLSPTCLVKDELTECDLYRENQLNFGMVVALEIQRFATNTQVTCSSVKRQKQQWSGHRYWYGSQFSRRLCKVQRLWISSFPGHVPWISSPPQPCPSHTCSQLLLIRTTTMKSTNSLSTEKTKPNLKMICNGFSQNWCKSRF